MFSDYFLDELDAEESAEESAHDCLEVVELEERCTVRVEDRVFEEAHDAGADQCAERRAEDDGESV